MSERKMDYCTDLCAERGHKVCTQIMSGALDSKYDAVKRAATLCLPHILHGDTVDRGCSYL